jgi:hypothetical protein
MTKIIQSLFKIQVMSVEIITKEDLQVFRQQLINDLKDLLVPKAASKRDWLRSREVRRLLNISPGTLQSFRVNGSLKPSKIGGILFYRYSDIERLLNENANDLG